MGERKETRMETRMEWKKNLYGLTAGQCELPAREYGEKKKQQRWNGNKNLYGLTAGQCEFYPQGNEKAEHKCNMPSTRKGSKWN